MKMVMEEANAPAIAQFICAPAAETRRTINGSLTVQLKLTFFYFSPSRFALLLIFFWISTRCTLLGPAPESCTPRSTCFAIRALCSFFILLNFLHSLKVFHFLFMPPAFAACLLFALILRSIVRFVGPALRSAEFLYLLADRAADWTIWPTHSYFDLFTNGIKFRSLRAYKQWKTCDMRIITAASQLSSQLTSVVSCIASVPPSYQSRGG